MFCSAQVPSVYFLRDIYLLFGKTYFILIYLRFSNENVKQYILTIYK